MHVGFDDLADVKIELNHGELTHRADRCGLEQAQRDPPARRFSGRRDHLGVDAAPPEEGPQLVVASDQVIRLAKLLLDHRRLLTLESEVLNNLPGRVEGDVVEHSAVAIPNQHADVAARRLASSPGLLDPQPRRVDP